MCFASTPQATPPAAPPAPPPPIMQPTKLDPTVAASRAGAKARQKQDIRNKSSVATTASGKLVASDTEAKTLLGT